MEALDRMGNMERNSGVNEAFQNILLTRAVEKLGDASLSRTQKAVPAIPKGLSG